MNEICDAVKKIWDEDDRNIRKVFQETCNIPAGVVVNNKGSHSLCGLLLEPISDGFYYYDKRGQEKRERLANLIISRRYSKIFDDVTVTNLAHFRISFVDSLSFGVAGLHAIGIAHGDLNEKNILFNGKRLGGSYRAQAYIIDTFNGYGANEKGDLKIISPLPDPFTLSNMIRGDGSLSYYHQDVYQVAAWCAMTLFTEQFLSHQGLHDNLASYKSNQNHGHLECAKAIERYRKSTLEPTIERIKDSVHNTTALNVTHEKDFVDTLTAALGPIEARPNAHELYIAIHEEQLRFS